MAATALTGAVPVVELTEGLRADGFVVGAPASVKRYTLTIDRSICRRARCGHCRSRGLQHVPYHRGAAYRALGVCQACGYGEEF